MGRTLPRLTWPNVPLEETLHAPFSLHANGDFIGDLAFVWRGAFVRISETSWENP